MTTKERILQVIQRLPDEVSMDQAIEELYLLRRIEIGIHQADAGDVVSHAEILKRYAPREERHG